MFKSQPVTTVARFGTALIDEISREWSENF